jgi:hypothetical protein
MPVSSLMWKAPNERAAHYRGQAKRLREFAETETDREVRFTSPTSMMGLRTASFNGLRRVRRYRNPYRDSIETLTIRSDRQPMVARLDTV